MKTNTAVGHSAQSMLDRPRRPARKHDLWSPKGSGGKKERQIENSERGRISKRLHGTLQTYLLYVVGVYFTPSPIANSCLKERPCAAADMRHT